MRLSKEFYAICVKSRVDFISSIRSLPAHNRGMTLSTSTLDRCLPLVTTWSDRRGAVLIEFAIVAPIFLMLMCGTLTYGGWIGLAHAVQQSANEGARAAIGGLDPDERADLARSRAMAAIRGYDVDPARVLIAVAEDGATLSVSVDYDATDDPRLALKLIPLPSTLIVRRSVVSLSGL